MEILHLSLTPLVGAPFRICRALNLHQGVTARSAVLDTTVGAYDRMVFDLDLIWAKDREEIIRLADTADVIHLHNFGDLESREFLPIDLLHAWKRGRPMVRQFHSSPWAIAAQSGTTVEAVHRCPIPRLVIAQFQARYYPTARIVPNIVFPTTSATAVNRTKKIRIGYAPTRFNSGRSSRWDTKGYFETVSMLSRLARRAKAVGIPLEIDVIEQVSHTECLARKSACNIFIDDLVTGSYHLNTLESLAAGSATLTYMDAATVQTVQAVTGRSDFPALNVGLEDAPGVLADLLKRPEVIASLGARSKAWMDGYWSPEAMAGHFLEAYRHAIAHPGQPFPVRTEIDEVTRAWLEVEFNDLCWANRQSRWPRVMPQWLRAARGRIGAGLRKLKLR